MQISELKHFLLSAFLLFNYVHERHFKYDTLALFSEAYGLIIRNLKTSNTLQTLRYGRDSTFVWMSEREGIVFHHNMCCASEGITIMSS
jgi:hypothetical protein